MALAVSEYPYAQSPRQELLWLAASVLLLVFSLMVQSAPPGALMPWPAWLALVSALVAAFATLRTLLRRPRLIVGPDTLHLILSNASTSIPLSSITEVAQLSYAKPALERSAEVRGDWLDLQFNAGRVTLHRDRFNGDESFTRFCKEIAARTGLELRHYTVKGTTGGSHGHL